MKYLLVSFLFFIIFFSSYSQPPTEICNNGLDDDFDGFIDCYDGDCSSNPANQCDFIVPSTCNAVPPQFPQFTMTLDFASPNETTNHLSRMAVGDLDRDGMPEFVTMNRYTRNLFILNGSDGSIKRQINVSWEPYWEIAIGNINNDNCAEIFFIGYQNLPGTANDGVYLFSYDCNLNLLWTSAQRLRGDPINFGLADFDNDGLIELYAKDEIYDAHTGVRIIQSTTPTYNRINGGPVAANILDKNGADLDPPPVVNPDDDGQLELIIGLAIYKVNLGARTLNSGSLTLLRSRPEYFIRNEYNATSIADYNQDGYIDIVASGSTIAHNTNTTIFFWDVKNNQINTYRDLASAYGPNGWGSGTGRVNIADLDGDGKLNVSYVSGRYLYALKEDLTLLWRVNINEETSGYTGCTLFDFNGDGKSEIVYRDERFLYIINGTDGTIYNQQTCVARTNREYPIVADVDADGSTELCVTCGFDDALANTNFNNINFSRFSHIRVFKSAAEPWVPARRVWNQHGYFVVNVNDDLTIPKQTQRHWLTFSNGSCTQGPSRPLNKFLNQSPFLNPDGCPIYAAPDIAFAVEPTVVSPTCPDLNFTVSFKITNLGDVALTGLIPVSFYASDPEKPGAVKLNTIQLNLSNFNRNDIFSVDNVTVNGIGSDSVFVVLNDAGTTVPTPISLPNTSIFECDYDNIRKARVNPLPVKLTAIQANPNEKCLLPPNGSARAFIPVNGVENTTDYDFYWSNGTVAKPISSVDFIGAIYTGLLEGDYTVYARHKTANCNSDTVQVAIDSVQSQIPGVTINVTNQTSCNPPNGRLEAVVTGGNTGYSFEWFDNTNSLGITTAVANGLTRGNYTVVVSRNGCTDNKSAFIDGNALDPTVTAVATNVINCQDLNSGSVTASVTLGGAPQSSTDYTFEWYFSDASSTRGSLLPPSNGTGPTRTGLPAGFYEVVAIKNDTQCASNSFDLEIQTQTVTPTVAISELSPQTSCDPLNPNGRLQASVTIGGIPQPASDFTFEWYVGQNTLPANLHTQVSGTNGSIAENVKGGGQFYTVKVISSSQCFATAFERVSELLEIPLVSLTATPNGICDPSLVIGTAINSGGVVASITYAGNPDNNFTNYTFEWYDGSQAIGTKRPETSNSLSGVTSGFYTLVVTRQGTLCQALPQTAEVINSTVLPVIQATADPSTNCDPTKANGGVQVTDVDGLGTPSKYTFEWHRGNTIAGYLVASSPVSLDTLQGASGRYYTALVTNTENGCQNTATVEVIDSKELPIITAASTANTFCVGADGTFSLSSITYQGLPVAAPFTGYSINWSSGETTSTANNKPAGNYSVTVTKSDVGCTSDPVNVSVIDNVFIPVINITVTNQTSCDNTALNGAVSVSVDESSIGGSASTTDPALYSFAWENNSNPFVTPGVSVGNSSSISGLSGNQFYTVTVTRTASGCVNTKSEFLPEVITQPIVAAAVSSDVTRCDTPDGSILANVGGLQNGFTFFWLNETGSNQTADANAVINNANATKTNDGSYTFLIPGYYTVVARNNTTSCISQPITRQVLDATVLSNIAITLGPTLPSSCGALDGQMSALVTGGTGSYDLFWHKGGPSNSNINSFTNPPQFNPPNDVPFQTVLNSSTSNLTNIESSLYTLVVRDKGNGCGNYETIFLPFLNAHDLTSVVTPSTICPITVGNGSVQVTVSSIPAPNNFTNFTYRFYRGENPNPAQQIGPVVGPGASVNNPMVYSSLAPGMYTVEVRQDLAAFGSNCPVYDVVEVKANAYSPVVDITSIAPNRSCDLLNGADGSAVIQFNTDPNDITTGITYTIDVSPAPRAWPGPVVRGPYKPAPPLPDTFTINGLSSTNSVPFYTVTLTSSNNCVTQRLITVPNQPVLPQVQNADLVSTPSLYCDPSLEINAAAQVTNVNVNGVAGNLNDFSFSWFTNASLTSAVLTDEDGDASPAKGGEVLSNVGAPTPSAFVTAGSYWVVAKNKNPIGLGCESSPAKVDILDQSKSPLVNLVATSNTACDTNFEGSIQVSVTNPGSVPASLNYSYNWLSTVTSIVSPPTSNGDGLGVDDNYAGLQDGTPYVVEVTNVSSGCKTTGQTTITRSNIPIIIPTASVLPQLICNPDGSITVDDVFVGGVKSLNHADFLFNWYKDSPNSSEIVPIAAGNDVLDNTDLFTAPLSMGAGTYFVKVKRVSGSPASGCESAPLKVNVIDLSRQPDISFTSVVPNSSCDPLNPNGSIVANAFERSGPVGNYTFQWTFNGGALPVFTSQTDASPMSQLSDAGKGQYVIEVTNTATNCKFTKLQNIDTNESLSLPNIVDIDVVNPVNCLPQGSLRVVSLTIGGTTTFTNPPDDLDADFDYEWYKGSLPAGLMAGEISSSLNNQLPGTYFVKVKNLTTQCISAAVEAVIDSTAINYPVISVTQLAPQVICTVNLGSGVLSALADGQSDTNANYTFTWFNNLNASGSSFDNRSTIDNLIAGDYSVLVQDLTTNCQSSAFFILPENKNDFLPILSLSSNPVTRCDTNDGTIFASAVKFQTSANPVENYPFSPLNYTADLYIGSPPANINSPEFPNMPNDPNFPLLNENFVSNGLASGVYTVRLTDNNTGCVTIGSVNIDDERKIPVPQLSTLAPVTNCTPTDPNGVARVLVDGTFVGYEFNWFEGTSTSAPLVYTGVEYSELKADPIVYTVQAINLATGCAGSAQTRITNGTVAIPIPQVVVLSHVTSCFFDNGALSASVNGNTKDYVFDWYDGKTETPPSDFVGEIYDSLSVGSYSVTATSRITGCKSPLVSADILMKQEFPEFDFQVTNASCDQPNGFATVFFTSIIGIGKIEWFQDNNLIATGPNLIDVTSGTYTIEAESELGCKTTGQITIDADIRPRNGISRNGDALNDYFHIDCIEQFLSNNVKIYNRAGTLVYEADGYDNSSIFFDGISNRGVSPMGTNLPDGTYYYIVDKRDGSKPVAGYLEIVK